MGERGGIVIFHGYESFGSLLPGRNYSSDSYRFGFQGQEKDDEVYGATGTSYAFTYRMHDARVGRFLSIDPLAAKYAYNSPYAFSENRVIDGIEMEGLEYLPIHSQDGQPDWDTNHNGRMDPNEAKEGNKLVGTLATAASVFSGVGEVWFAARLGWRAALRVATKELTEEAISQATGLPFNPRDVADFAKGMGRSSVRFLTNKASDKVAVIGQGMDDVEKLAGAIPGAQTFPPSAAARDEWNGLVKAADGGRVSEEVVRGSKMYKENQTWIQKVKDEGYNVIDLGTKEGAAPSSFYNMEREVIDGQ